MSIYYVLGTVIRKIPAFLKQTIQHGETMNKMKKYIVC